VSGETAEARPLSYELPTNCPRTTTTALLVEKEGNTGHRVAQKCESRKRKGAKSYKT
jgi:hypothetical protein